MVNEPLWGRIMIKLSHLLLTISSATNILIYSTKVMNNELAFISRGLIIFIYDRSLKIMQELLQGVEKELTISVL